MSADAELALVFKARNLAGREVDRLHGQLGRLRGGAGKLGTAFKTLAKVGIGGVVVGIAAAVGFLGLATKAAADEQKGIARLTATLKANVKGFDGNSAAIERVISKREELGFSDDAQRASLAILVTKYKDVAKAQDIQAVAMDVARLKGIDLEAATQLVSKGLDGNRKMLKQLGIELPKTATEQEILTAIQKKAAGQADAYGKTAAGAQEAFGIAIDNVTEDIGAGLLPIMTQAFTWLRTKGIPAVRGIIASIGRWMDENRPLINQIREVLTKAVQKLVKVIGDVVTWIGSVAKTIGKNRDAMNVLRVVFDLIRKAIGLAVDVTERFISFVAKVVDAISKNKGVIRGFTTVWNFMADAIGRVVAAFKWIVGNVGRIVRALNSIKLPDVTGITDHIPHFATGGTVPGRRDEPSLAVVHGGERITRAGPGADRGGASDGGVRIVGVSASELADVIDRRLYIRLQRAAPTSGRGG